MRIALLQLNSSDDPAANLSVTCDMLREAAEGGATFVLTPEVTNCVSASRARQNAVLELEEQDQTLARLRDEAARHRIWLLLGSLALKSGAADGRYVNRSFLILPDGSIAARYDKIHMFDVQISETERYHESAGYRPGENAVVVDGPIGPLGMTICYDLRFPHLYRDLAQAGATMLTVPSAFSPVTGAAHWEPLLRARAIETGCFVIAPAQCGTHAVSEGKARKTYGHSLVVAPWGEVLANGGTETGVVWAEIEPEAVAEARGKVPSITARSVYTAPQPQ
ncbi:MAG: carbon-nitrogen hydrolase family protein [Pseudomonadota bacterium]